MTTATKKKPAAAKKPAPHVKAKAPAKKQTLGLNPSNDRVLVKKDPSEQYTSAGLIIPDNAKDKPQTGTVLEVGPGKFDDAGARVPMGFKKGDKILYAKYSGIDIKINGEQLVVLTDREIFGTLTVK